MGYWSAWILLVICSAVQIGSATDTQEGETPSVDADYCGRKEPEPDKLCVSIKLPWQRNPIYFCTEKGKVNYRRKCTTNKMYCPVDNVAGSTLQVSTPWDCCPMFSQPDPCVDAKCPPPPFNRTCSEFYSDNYWDCCPHYHCEQEDKDTCHVRKQQPGCLSHPKGKEHCLGFIDPNGCCNKYQCENDTKPGICPTLAYHRQRYLVATALAVRNSSFAADNENSTNSKDNLVHATFLASNFPPPSYTIASRAVIQRCVGDYTCPRSMKCCPSIIHENPTITTLISKGSPPHLKIAPYESTLKPRAVHGYCMEPIFDKRDKT